MLKKNWFKTTCVIITINFYESHENHLIIYCNIFQIISFEKIFSRNYNYKKKIITNQKG